MKGEKSQIERKTTDAAGDVQAEARAMSGAIPLFRSLTAAELTELLKSKVRRTYQAGEVIAKQGTVMRALVIVARGVLVAWEEEGGAPLEGVRWTPGFYFGEQGLLTDKPLSGDVTALTPVVTHEVSKDALAPVLKGRPQIVEELGDRLERDLATRRGVHPRPLAPALVTAQSQGVSPRPSGTSSPCLKRTPVPGVRRGARPGRRPRDR